MLDHDGFVVSALVEEGRLARAAAEQAKVEAAHKSRSITSVLVERCLVTAREVALVRASICEVPFVDISQYVIDIRNTGMLSHDTAEALIAFPLFDVGDTVTVGMVNPLDLRAVDQLRTILKADIEPVLCEEAALRWLIDSAFVMAGQSGAAYAPEPEAELTTGKEPIVAAVNQILAQAVDRGASDIHLGPDEQQLLLRFRVDGVLQPQQGPPLAQLSGLVQRLKVMANLDLTQTRRPQDGKFRYTHKGRAIDVRISLIPTVLGENVVIRLLSSAGVIRGFDDLGVAQGELDGLSHALEQPNGMVLVTGPTGSGKTTTLYTALKKLNSPERNIMTIEDPVEVRMPMIRQIQVNTEIGLTFAGALRSILRQDPDVVFVGEIRDDETARIAIQAALTGHLVLSSLHTNDAAGAVPRLRDLGCPNFALVAAVLAVVGQRLVRRVCPECVEPHAPEPAALMHFGTHASEGRFVRGVGCARCTGSGYKGRLGIYELMRATPAWQRAIEAGATATSLRKTAAADGFRSMASDGLDKAALGLTTLSEVLRVVASLAVDSDAQSRAPDAAGRAAA